ncbi:MAG TPA: hypothetical protein VMX14_03685 [Anaerolineae bacterium]|nr:hypothetical protein [Anaerolineae bacterium]HUW13376.1 hypothetical protein [Anaerolineae bacterium]
MTRARDSQRSKVYNGEDEYWVAVGNHSIPEVWQIQRWVNRIVDSPWWTQRWPHVIVVQVNDGRRRRNACGQYLGGGTGLIKVPRPCRRKMVILHELAHVVTPDVHPWHGEVFVGRFLALVDKWMGQLEGLALRWFLSKNGVKWQELHRQADDQVVADSEPLQMDVMYGFALALPLFGGFLVAALIEPAYVLIGVAAAMAYLLARSFGTSKWFARLACWATLLILSMIR